MVQGLRRPKRKEYTMNMTLREIATITQATVLFQNEEKGADGLGNEACLQAQKEALLDRTIQGFAQDSRLAKEGDLFFAIRGENQDGHRFVPAAWEKGCRSFIISDPQVIDSLSAVDEQVPPVFLLVEDGEKALITLAHYVVTQTDIHIVGVTGSTGKTTTRDMTACVLRSRYKTGSAAGNFNTPIGLSLTVLGFEQDTEIGVLEMGMYVSGEIAHLVSIAPPEVALITNIGISHLENFDSREGIFLAKMEIASQLKENNLLIVNEGDYLSREAVEAAPGQPSYQVWVTGTGEDCNLQIQNIREEKEGIAFDLTLWQQEEDKKAKTSITQAFQLPVPGRHNALNAALAVATGLHYDISMAEAAQALRQLEVTGSRLRIVEQGGVTVIDDTYNASPDSMRGALEVLEDRWHKVLEQETPTAQAYAILGDMYELGPNSQEEHAAIGRFAAEKGLTGILTCGDLAKDIHRGAAQLATSTMWVQHFEDRDQLALALAQKAKPGDLMLFKGSRGMKMETILAATCQQMEKEK